MSAPSRSTREPMPRWVPRAIALALVGVLVLLATLWALSKLRSLLILVLVSLFLSFAIEPAVNRLARRGWRRGAATIAVFVVVGLAIAIFVIAMGSLLADQVVRFIDEGPRYIEQIETWLDDEFDVQINTDDIVAEFNEGGSAASLASRLAGNLLSVGAAIVNVVFQLLTILLFTFYLVADGPRLRRAICGALPPDRQRDVLRIWELAIDKTGGYIYSRALLALLSFLAHWLAFILLSIPFPLPLAIWVGVLSQFIPVVGTYIAGVLPVLIALLDEPISAVWTLIVIVLYQQIENYLFAPRVTAQTMSIHPAIAFGTVIAGASLLGTVGALLAVPAAATIQAFVSSYVTHHDIVDSELLDEPGPRPVGDVSEPRPTAEDAEVAPDPADD